MAAETRTRLDQLTDATPRPPAPARTCRRPGRAITARSARSIWSATLVTVLAVSVAAPAAPAESPTPEGMEFFEKKVRPILVEKCQKCHGSQRQKGGLRLDSREAAFKGGESGPVIVAGHPENSQLVPRHQLRSRRLPDAADGEAQRRFHCRADRLGTARSSPWPAQPPADNRRRPKSGFDFAERARHWSFQSLRPGVPPRAAQTSWVRNPVDRFLESRLDAAGLDPAPAADRRTLLRRITFDLTGLPPTREEIHAFLADNSPTAYEKVVDRLLASPHYGVRWGRHWLDLVRFAETCGHEFDFDIPAVWPYRDYVVRAFNDDVPYNAFVTEHIAGDLLASPRRNPRDAANESIIGTAFWWFAQGKQSPVDVRAESATPSTTRSTCSGRHFSD